MNGGFNPLKDLYKTEVFDLCRWRNKFHTPELKGPNGEVIPERIISKPPSAELREDQKDEDSLPPYEVLDPILHSFGGTGIIGSRDRGKWVRRGDSAPNRASALCRGIQTPPGAAGTESHRRQFRS